MRKKYLSFLMLIFILAFSIQQLNAQTPPPPPEVEEAPPPPPPMAEEKFKIVDNMPEFPGCEDVTDKQERKTCWQTKMINYIGANLKYPKLAKENGVQGRAILQFVVEKDGSLSNINILRDPGAGCGAEAKRVVESMPNWNPGTHRGKPVKVQFTLPISFKFDEPKEEIALEPEVEEKPKRERVFKVVEEMPRFPGCEDIDDMKARRKCADNKMLQFIYGNLKYPAEARKNKVQGRVILQYIVEEDGTVSDVTIKRDPGDGCGEEAKRVAEMMPKWIPGKHRNQAVPVKFTLPVTFKLGK